MGNVDVRLQRYLEEELGECRDEDVENRLDELSTLEERTTPPHVGAQLDVLSALANETRYTLLSLLVEAREELCVCEMNAVVDVSESGLSHALSKLVDAGLADSRKDGRWKNYWATNRGITLVRVLQGVVGGDT